MNKRSLKLFFSYAHEDENYRDELVKHLSMLKKLGVIEEWYDRKLIAGDSLDSEIIAKLESSHIILFLVSSDFLSSKYCYEEELKKALELKKELEDLDLVKLRGAHIVKVIDFLPKSATELNKIIQDVSLDSEETSKVLDVVKKY